MGAVIDQVLLTRPKAVVLVSCNTAALASDLGRADKHGYSLKQLKLYEMFSQVTIRISMDSFGFSLSRPLDKETSPG